MSYRFNNRRGGVTCDRCDLLIAQDLGPKEYERDWNETEDLCMACKDKPRECKWSQKTTGIWQTECGGKMMWLMEKCPKCKRLVSTEDDGLSDLVGYRHRNHRKLQQNGGIHE